MEKTFQDKTNLYNKLEEALSKKDVIVLTKSDKSKLERLEKKHKVSFDSLYKEFEKGVKVEKEHMKNIKETKKIALVHLAEDPKYYTKLKKAKLEETITKELKEESLPSKLKSDVEVEYHKNLNPQFWLNNHLKSNIRKNLLNLSKFYFKQLDLGVELKDVIFTGSLANYNYTNLSDVDLHLVIDYKELTDDEDFAKEYFGDKRAIWADSNDIKINGFPVEIYIQDVKQLDDKGMGAMYSLLNNKWIKKPKYKLPEVDKHLITQKVNKYLDIFNKISMMNDTIKKVDSYNKVFEKIRDNRRKSTKEEGEFSVDNLVFKVLRNKKVFDIIRDNKKEIVNNVFSINSN
jgi:predicted nucleotidyltransferase